MPHASALFFENDLGRITIEPQGYIRLQWLGGMYESSQVRAQLKQLLRAQLQTGHCRLLLDERQASAFSADDQYWLINEWLPQAVAHTGSHYAAHLLANDVFARLSIDPVAEKARELGSRHAEFRHEPEALRWIAQQPASVPGPR